MSDQPVPTSFLYSVTAVVPLFNITLTIPLLTSLWTPPHPAP